MSNNQSPSSFLIAVSQLLNHYSEAIPAGQKIKAYLAGGAAIHYWIRTRQTGDVDVEFSRQFFIDDFFVKYLDETGKEQTLYVDRSYNPMFSLLHEDYQINAIPIGKELQISTKIDLSVLSPLDLVISKLARYAPNDREDIINLINHGLVDLSEFKVKSKDTLSVAIGCNKAMITENITDTILQIEKHHVNIATHNQTSLRY